MVFHNDGLNSRHSAVLLCLWHVSCLVRICKVSGTRFKLMMWQTHL